MVRGELQPSRVVDPENERSENALYVDRQRGVGNHVCIVDDAGISALLLYSRPARCLRSRVVGANTIETSARPAEAVVPQAGGSHDVFDDELWDWPEWEEFSLGDVESPVRGTPARVRGGDDDDADEDDGQAHLYDQELRIEIEDEGQQRLTAHFEAEGWKVRDTRVGNPYDAVATMGEYVLYLEAKGTTTSGATVMVTRGEVLHARANPGSCVLGIVSGIEVSDGHVVPGTGRLQIVRPWTPVDEELTARSFDYRLPGAEIVSDADSPTD